MSKKESIGKLVKELFENVIEEKEHFFDETSEKCKSCSDFIICKEFAPIIDKIKSLKLSKEVNEEIADFIDCIKHNAGFVKNNAKDACSDYTKLLRIRLYDVHKRFEDINNFKHYDILVNNLTEEELSSIRNIISNTNKLIRQLFEKVANANAEEETIMLNNLSKGKSYEDMSKEELIELLKHK